MFKKEFELEIKSVGEESADIGTFNGYVSVYNIPDLYGEIVIPGAFDDSLAQHNSVFPLLWQHNPNEPIGTFIAKSDDKGLAVSGRICLGTQRGREAHALLKMKAEGGHSPIQGMSIGFNTEKDDYEKDGTRLLQTLDLWEGSLATFPANQLATVDEIKSATDLNMAVKVIATADPRELEHLEPSMIRAAKNVLTKIPEPLDDVDRIAEFIANEVKEWTRKK